MQAWGAIGKPHAVGSGTAERLASAPSEQRYGKSGKADNRLSIQGRSASPGAAPTGLERPASRRVRRPRGARSGFPPPRNRYAAPMTNPQAANVNLLQRLPPQPLSCFTNAFFNGPVTAVRVAGDALPVAARSGTGRDGPLTVHVARTNGLFFPGGSAQWALTIAWAPGWMQDAHIPHNPPSSNTILLQPWAGCKLFFTIYHLTIT